jgi:hypothetical protein
MSLRDNDYDSGADDALKDLIDELETMIAQVEEDIDFDDGYINGISDALQIAKDMRSSLYG